MTTAQAIILAIIEGITEFLPISSTGHMIIASSVMGIASDDFVKMFTVAIQFGAILSVIVLYWRRFMQSIDFYLKLFVAFLPAAIIGKLFNDQIDALLENVVVVGFSLLIGGVVLLFVDKWFSEEDPAAFNAKDHSDNTLDRFAVRPKKDDLPMGYATALKIGFFQVIAMIPGVSRSAATIIGGLTQKLTRKAAAEFSFLLAVPTMFAATVYKMYKFHKETGIASEHISVLVIGNIVAFIVALIAIKGFITYLSKHGFRVFGWYRIVAGLVILAMYFMGYQLDIV